MVDIVTSEDGDGAAQIILRQANGIEGLQFDAGSSSGAKIRLYQNDYDPDSASRFDDIGVLIDGNATDGGNSTGYGRMRLRNEQGQTTIIIDGDHNDSGDGRIETDILRINGGSDLSESFDVFGAEIRAGYLVSIDANHPGKLRVSNAAYDRKLAGVISGAGGIDTGLLMGQTGTIADGEYPVAMSGRVYCWADASEHAINPGDLLTSSNTAGHAKRADDSNRVHGAVIGKAMSPLTEGRGLVLVLIRPL